MKKIIILTNMISPYRIPFFNKISSSKGIKLKVIALSKKENNRSWNFQKNKINFDYEIMDGFHKFFWKKGFAFHINFDIFKKLKQFDPNIVITSGYSTLAYWKSLLYTKLFNKKFILWNGTTNLSSKNKNFIFKSLKKMFISLADSYLTYGTKATEFLKKYGANKKNIYTGINTVNMQFFRKKAFQKINKKRTIKKRKNYPGLLLLFVGRLVKIKNTIQVLKALKEIDNDDIGLIIVGDGPRRKKLEKYCRKNQLQNVYFKGYKQRNDLPHYYALADAFIFPTIQEVWGLVINEALASGLYVLCSKKAGSYYDLIKEKWNGTGFSPTSKKSMIKAIKFTKDNLKKIKGRRKKISKEATSKYNIDNYASTFIRAIKNL